MACTNYSVVFKFAPCVALPTDQEGAANMRTDDAILQINDNFSKTARDFSVSMKSTTLEKRGPKPRVGEKLQPYVCLDHFRRKDYEEKVTFSLALWQQ